jgi:CheY-like chemotaxis protein
VKDVLNAIVGLAWPVLIGVLAWRLLPSIRKVIDQRGFTIKAGGAEITVQQASDQLKIGVEDLREQVSALKLRVSRLQDAGGPPASPITGAPPASPITAGVPKLRRVLWVDDHPENNAYEVDALERKGVNVTLERSTADGLRAAGEASPPFDAIITDMGRTTDGQERPEAGLELIRALTDHQISSPVVVYASAPAIARAHAALEAAGVPATGSATELLELLGRLGLE